MNYISAIAGFTANGGGSYYQGPQDQLLGEVGGFAVSVLLARPARPGVEMIFGCGDVLGGNDGWGIFLDAPIAAGDMRFTARCITDTTGIVEATAETAESPLIRELHVLTMVVDPNLGANGALRLFVNGHSYIEVPWALNDDYVPAAAGSRAGVGIVLPGITNALEGKYIVGLAYSGAAVVAAYGTNEWNLLQQAAMQIGDMADLQQVVVGDISGIVPNWDNLWSVRRGASGAGLPLASFGGGLATLGGTPDQWDGELGNISLEKVEGDPDTFPLGSLAFKGYL